MHPGRASRWRSGLVFFQSSKDREHCCCLLRDICSQAVSTSRAATHNVAPQWQTSPLLSASVLPSPQLESTPAPKPTPFCVSDRSLSVLACFLSFIHIAQKQEESVPAQQSDSNIASLKYSRGLHSGNEIRDCSTKTHFFCSAPCIAVSGLPLPYYLQQQFSFIFNVSLG